MKSRSRSARIAAQLADLKMPGALEALDEVLAGVDGGGTTAAEAIERLLAAQITLRNSRRLQTAMRSSRLVDAAQDSHSASTRRNYLAAWRRFQMWADGEGLCPIPALPETVAAYRAPRRAGRQRPVARIAPHGPCGDPLPSHRNRTREPGRRRRGAPGAARTHPSGGVRGSHHETGRRPHGRGAVRDPRHCSSAARGTERPNRAGQHGPPPRSRGYRARVGHAGRTASALRSCRAHLGRHGVSERHGSARVTVRRSKSLCSRAGCPRGRCSISRSSSRPALMCRAVRRGRGSRTCLCPAVSSPTRTPSS